VTLDVAPAKRKKLVMKMPLCPGADFFRTFFLGKILDENSAEIFPLKNVEENWNFLRKKF
jgi:hypothetical protein